MEKIANVIEKIGEQVKAGYQKIEDGAVNGYRCVENGAVKGFARVSDRCVEVLFCKEGERAAEAKARLNRKIGGAAQ